MNVQEIENAITALSPEELAAFSQWFEEYTADQWDKQIEADALARLFRDRGVALIPRFRPRWPAQHQRPTNATLGLFREFGRGGWRVAARVCVS